MPIDIRAEKISMIGNYAILVDWSDGHNTGFFPFNMIRDVAGVKHKQGDFQGCEI
ncbi:MAG: gamma-butyrobetaine hydroxylase-like domain-containing protein [Pontiellaceae bacterium]